MDQASASTAALSKERLGRPQRPSLAGCGSEEELGSPRRCRPWFPQRRRASRWAEVGGESERVKTRAENIHPSK